MTDVAEIARGLTKAQREALSAREWSMLRQYKAGILELLHYRLLTNDGLGHTLTPLGLAVAAHLKDKDATHG